jgi:hypothetical protein
MAGNNITRIGLPKAPVIQPGARAGIAHPAPTTPAITQRPPVAPDTRPIVDGTPVLSDFVIPNMPVNAREPHAHVIGRGKGLSGQHFSTNELTFTRTAQGQHEVTLGNPWTTAHFRHTISGESFELTGAGIIGEAQPTHRIPAGTYAVTIIGRASTVTQKAGIHRVTSADGTQRERPARVSQWATARETFAQFAVTVPQDSVVLNGRMVPDVLQLGGARQIASTGHHVPGLEDEKDVLFFEPRPDGWEVLAFTPEMHIRSLDGTFDEVLELRESGKGVAMPRIVIPAGSYTISWGERTMEIHLPERQIAAPQPRPQPKPQPAAPKRRLADRVKDAPTLAAPAAHVDRTPQPIATWSVDGVARSRSTHGQFMHIATLTEFIRHDDGTYHIKKGPHTQAMIQRNTPESRALKNSMAMLPGDTVGLRTRDATTRRLSNRVEIKITETVAIPPQYDEEYRTDVFRHNVRLFYSDHATREAAKRTMGAAGSGQVKFTARYDSMTGQVVAFAKNTEADFGHLPSVLITVDPALQRVVHVEEPYGASDTAAAELAKLEGLDTAIPMEWHLS